MFQLLSEEKQSFIIHYYREMTENKLTLKPDQFCIKLYYLLIGCLCSVIIQDWKILLETS